MKRMIFLAAILFTVFAFCNFNQAWAEDKPQMTFVVSGSKPLAQDFSLNCLFMLPNLTVAVSPYTYLGVSYQFNKNFTLAYNTGFAFEAKPEDRGIINALVLSASFGNLAVSTDLEYWAGLDIFWSYQYLGYKLGDVWVGADNRNSHFVRAEDEKKSAYQIGPSLKIPFSERVSVKLVYYYSLETDGENANIFRGILNINL